ncbi:uncharacterized protein LOC142139650 [Mixophyes fleayi]|uniref:uncharacterized protein LOC142139650 n=1 Tax=Mixophyes fleayi TaxID=3061075 RepID=UPI003F4DD882
MLRGPPTIATALYLLLLTDLVPTSPVRDASHSAGDTVTLRCLEGINTTIHRENTTQITWRKRNNSHNLVFGLWKNITLSNFTDTRISFLSPEQPLTLRIADTQPSDSGKYTCDITTTDVFFTNSWTLHVSENGMSVSSVPRSTVIAISSSLAGAAFVLIVVWIIYYNTRSKSNKIPTHIHQTRPETNQPEEPVYDTPQENYVLRFNALYDTTPATQVK